MHSCLNHCMLLKWPVSTANPEPRPLTNQMSSCACSFCFTTGLPTNLTVISGTTSGASILTSSGLQTTIPLNISEFSAPTWPYHLLAKQSRHKPDHWHLLQALTIPTT